MARTVSSLINTSADDCKASLPFCKREDLPLLREALAACGEGRKTMGKHIASRIKQLEKEASV